MEVRVTRQFLPDLFGRGAGHDVFSNLQREVDRVFSDFGRGMPALGEFRRGAMALKVNVSETDSAVEVSAEIPGVDAKDIDVQLRDGILTIKGEKKSEREEKEENYHLVERSYGSFSRSMTLPAAVNLEKIEAKYDKGVLTVTCPKKEEVKPKPIEIKTT
jgi:HSP20 family protein